MFKTAAATVLSAAIALGSFGAAPAQAADSEELARLLFGAATIAIIVSGLNNQNGNQARAGTRIHEQDRGRDQYRTHDRGAIRGEVITRRNGHGTVITPHRPAQTRSVPQACQRTIATSNGTRRLFGVPCLQREGVNIARLPQDCRRTVDLQNRSVDAFGSRCLRSSGVTIVN
jgi:hypothetical protein